MVPSKTELAEKLLALQQTLFPRSCSLCREALCPKQHSSCSDCINDLPYNINSCLLCAEPLVSKGICPACQKHPPNFRCCHTLCDYNYPISFVIKRIKKNPYTPEIKQLSILFAERIQTHYAPEDLPKIFIPMPIHPLKMLYRGFNQSLIIAQLLSSKLAKTEVKNIGNCKKFGKPQRFRTREQRLKIVPANFIIYQQEEIQGRSLALVDDAVTTGSTAIAITKSLLNAGAKSVDLWCIAKTSWHNGSGSIKIYPLLNIIKLVLR